MKLRLSPKEIDWYVTKKELPDKNLPNRILDYHVWSSWRMTKISRHVSLQHFFCKVVMQEKSDFLSLSLSSKVKLLFLSSCWDGKKIYLTTILFPFETKENRTWGNNISHSKKKNCTWIKSALLKHQQRDGSLTISRIYWMFSYFLWVYWPLEILLWNYEIYRLDFKGLSFKGVSQFWRYVKLLKVCHTCEGMSYL